MPELPEVETIARDLNEIVGGLTITEAALSFDKIVATDHDDFYKLLTGAKIENVERFGKQVRFNLSGGKVMLAHLKMTGQFHLGLWPQKDAWPPHTRAALKLNGLKAPSDTLYYKDIRKFGRLRVFDQNAFKVFCEETAQGPDPLTIDADTFHRIISAKRGRLKAVLLDQTNVCGLGNIYADEALFAARLSPCKSAAELTGEESGRLLAAIKELLSESINLRGSTTSNYQGLKGGGSFQHRHKVYGRGGQPCAHCGTALAKAVVAGRGTVSCPACQGGGEGQEEGDDQ